MPNLLVIFFCSDIFLRRFNPARAPKCSTWWHPSTFHLLINIARHKDIKRSYTKVILVLLFFHLDEDEDFVNKKASKKPKENGTSSSICLGTSGLPKADIKPKLKCKSISPVKLTPTSAIDFFGTGTIQRSEKKLVSSKRKEVSIANVWLLFPM